MDSQLSRLYRRQRRSSTKLSNLGAFICSVVSRGQHDRLDVDDRRQPACRFHERTVDLVSFSAILLLALGLAMDATAVSAARGLAVPSIRARHVVLVAGFFGGFQALMPIIGWLLGARIGPVVQAWDHWIAFVLLASIGGKMLWEARGESSADGVTTVDHFALRSMFVLAIATSIDALAVGITLPMLHAPFALSVVTIGVVTALLSAAGLFAGRRFGAMLGKRLDLAGGVVLIGLGFKILIDHLQAP
jgi:putative Mn2+ efflux pump MntP